MKSLLSCIVLDFHRSRPFLPYAMEALAALSLAGTILQLIETGTKVVNTAKEIQDSARGMTKENESLEKVTSEMRALSLDLSLASTKAHSDDERALRCVAQECYDLTEQLLRLIQDTIPSNPGSFREALRTSFRSQRYKGSKLDLERKLADRRNQLHLHLSRLLRCAFVMTNE